MDTPAELEVLGEHLQVTCSVRSEVVVVARVLVLAGWECGQATPDDSGARRARGAALESEVSAAMDSYKVAMGVHSAATGPCQPALLATPAALPGGCVAAGRSASVPAAVCGKRKRARDDVGGGDDLPSTAWQV